MAQEDVERRWRVYSNRAALQMPKLGEKTSAAWEAQTVTQAGVKEGEE
jgi:hypothetical protein